MREYLKPIIEEEVIEIEDIVANSPANPMSSPDDEFTDDTDTITLK